MRTHQDDLVLVLARRHDNGGDFWASEDGRIYVGNPYSTIGALGILHELGVPADNEAVAGALALLRESIREDGRIRVARRAPLYPCYTAEAARILCRFGEKRDGPLGRVVDYLLEAVHPTGGWRCSFSRFGKGPETECASPGATLYALDALRFLPEHLTGTPAVDDAVGFLLDHWDTKKPIGPCHHGMGSKFHEIEYPFIRYNVFYYAYVLSFYGAAHGDPRFDEALAVLEAKLDGEGRMVVESPHRGLKGLSFCARGEPSGPATGRYREIVARAAA